MAQDDLRALAVTEASKKEVREKSKSKNQSKTMSKVRKCNATNLGNVQIRQRSITKPIKN